MKIKKVKLINFLSHKESVFNFSENINIIKGHSFAGKSALIRALDFFFYGGRDSEEYLRYDTKFFTIEVEFSNGLIITREKGKDISRYVVALPNAKEEVYENFGIGIPEQVFKLFNIKEVYYEEDKSLKLNITHQFDSLFLFNETGSARGKILGLLTGANLIDLSLKNLNKDIRSYQQSLTTVLSKKESLVNELRSYEDLPLQEQFINSFKVNLDSYEYDSGVLGALFQYQTGILNIDSQISKALVSKKILSKVNTEDVEKELNYLNELNNIRNTYNTLNNTLNDTVDLQEKFGLVDFNVITKELEKLSDLHSLNDNLTLLNSKESKDIILLTSTQKQLEDCISNYKQDLLKEKVCPVCGTEVTEEIILNHLGEI